MTQKPRWQVREAPAVQKGTDTFANMLREHGRYGANFAFLAYSIGRAPHCRNRDWPLVAQNHAQ